MTIEKQTEKDVQSGIQFASGMNSALRDYWEEMSISSKEAFYMAFTGSMFGNIVAHIGKTKALIILDALRFSVAESDLDKKPEPKRGTA